MKCQQCNLVDMVVMVRNNKEVVYQCPKCKEIVKIGVEDEDKIIQQQKEMIEKQDTDN